MNLILIPARGLLAAGCAALAATALAACGDDDASSPSTTGAAPGSTKALAFTLTDTGCEPAKVTVPAGSVKIVAANPGTTKTDEIELKNADGIILGERENLAPGLSGDFTLTLQPGTYTLNCTFQNDTRDNGRITVTGSAAAQPAVDGAELTEAVATYKAGVGRQADQLVTATTAFVAALKAGDTQRAKDLFATTRSHYEQIEPIAESFGDLDPEIDARANDVADASQWTGFHRIEQILWKRDTTKGTERYADKLLADVKRLRDQIPALELQGAQIANGAVGLLDEVSASKITGEEDRYSHTDLTDFQANVDGAKAAFAAVKPVLAANGNEQLVSTIEQRMAALQQGLDKYRRSDQPSGFALYGELTEQDRRQFAQQVAALAEPLSLVAGKLLPAQG